MAALIVFVTCPRAKARALARGLVQGRHAACVNLVPAVASIYRWKGRLHQDPETLLMVKTTTARFSALKQAVLGHHPYELPEIIAVRVTRAHKPYLDWLTRQCE